MVSLIKCPLCEKKLKVKSMICEDCEVEFSGKINVKNDFFAGIDPEIAEFIKVFIYTEGSIKHTEKILNCSYPKVKNLLKKAKRELEIDFDREENEKEKILERLDKGEITAKEALELLK